MVQDRPIRIERRLSAILAADVAGYSRLMHNDEEATHAKLTALLTDAVHPAIVEHGGHVVKNTGDGFLAEFPSAVEAVRAAMQFQTRMHELTIDEAEDNRIALRVGINIGDVIIEPHDIFGDDVNIAARLESIAEPGGICVSSLAYEHVRGKVGVEFVDLGEQRLKNIARPIRIFKVLDRVAAAKKRPTLALPDKPSIAVLPFQNLSADPEQEYFADGIVEEIITALSHFKNLFVIARNSTFTLKGRAVDVKQVGRELGVRYVLEGSVRKAESHARIAAQLVDALTGAHLWADRFDGTLENIFDLQDSVTASVVNAIAPKLEKAEIERAKRKSTESLDAYDYYLRGISVVFGMTREIKEEALRLFSKAIELDPDFALAYARAAQCYALRKAKGWMVDRKQEVAEAARLARRAVELGKDDAVALSTGGLVLAYVVEDLEDGAACVDRAVHLNPNLAAAWNYDGWMKICFGEHNTAIDHLAHAMRLSPLDPHLWTWQFHTALAYFFAGRYNEAALWAEVALREQPNYLGALRVGAASNALAGRPEKTQQLMGRLRKLDPVLRISNLAGTMPPLRRPEDRERWVDGLRRAGLPE